MINLIKNEFIKILKKKSFYIVTFIFILYAILTNVIYKEMNVLNYFDGTTIEYLEEENKSLDLNNEDDLNIYVENLASIDEIKYQDNKTNSDKALITKYIYPLLIEKYTYQYIDKNEELRQEIDLQIKEYMDIIDKQDWTYFPKLEINNLENRLKDETNLINQNRMNDLIKLK